MALLEANCAASSIVYLALDGADQGIVHLAFGIEASECETVLATVWQKRARTMRVTFTGAPMGINE